MTDEKRVPWRTSPEVWEKLKPLANQMRHQPTVAERHLWQQIRSKTLGVKFRRQHTIDRFIVDFYCAAASLIIEVDGTIHEYTQQEDAIRQEFLESLGLRVLRFTNEEVLQDTVLVLQRIADVLKEQLQS
ncbi:MAG: DUF559 domain-containing protein [Anaerolineae bacterium]|nr:DUF559 domain-containing protein [Anaerolineae bacterium]